MLPTQRQESEAAEQRPGALGVDDPQEDRIGQQQRGELRPHHDRPASDAVRQPAAAERADDAETVAHDRSRKGQLGRHMQGVLGIGRHVLADIGDDGAACQHHQAEHDDARVGANNGEMFAAGLLQMFPGRVQIHRLRQAGAQPQSERQACRADQKGDPPALGIQRRLAHRPRQHHADQRADRGGDFLARGLP